MKKLFLIFMFFVPTLLFAAIGESRISVAPDGTELKWEKGHWDFFIMHKTLIDHVTGAANNDGGGDSTASNPQGDTFIESSTYTLTSKHIPPDADIDRAFLVWLSTQDPSNMEGPTDNSVFLTFTNATDPEITLTQEVTASFQGDLAETQQGDFEYEAINMPATLNTNTIGIYTYRVEVSDFMKKIIKMGRDKGIDSGEALYGDYTVSGMDGSNHQNYLDASALVGGWFMPFVYTSKHINTKNIYFYHSLAAYRFEKKELTISGFELPDEPIIKLGLVVFEGDPGLAMTVSFEDNKVTDKKADPEGLYIRSQHETDDLDYAPLYNKCNPDKELTDTYSTLYGSGTLYYTEMYNSISSVFSWSDPNEYWCVGNPDKLWPIDPNNPLEYAIDADIMMVDASSTGLFYGKFNKGDTSFNIKIGANQDQVYTNMLIVSVDTQNQGELYGECYPDGTCSEGLECKIEHNICLEPETDNNDTADTDNDNDTADTSDTGSDTGSTEPTDQADSDSGTEKGSWGELNGECYPNGTCNKGLACNKKQNICVKQMKSAGGCSVMTVY